MGWPADVQIWFALSGPTETNVSTKQPYSVAFRRSELASEIDVAGAMFPAPVRLRPLVWP
jgi:hypothetical protein